MAIHSSTIAWKNPMDRGAWQATLHRVAKSRTRLSDFTFTFTFVVIGLMKSCDTVVAIEEQKRKEKLGGGTSGKDFPSSQKEIYMGEALSSSILLAF